MDYLKVGYTPQKRKMFQLWRFMMIRCYNKDFLNYRYYGGRGIKVIKRWHNFENFYNDLKRSYQDDLYLTLIDRKKPYSVNNCRFVTRMELHKHKSNNVRVTIGGETKILSDWAREFGLDNGLVINRVNRGMDVIRALTEPKHEKEKYITILGETKTIGQWLKKSGISRDTYNARIENGWNQAVALLKPSQNPNVKKASWTINGVTKLKTEWLKEFGITETALYTRMKKHGLTKFEALMMPKYSTNKISYAMNSRNQNTNKIIS